MTYRPTIGLEIHAELKTRTKMFCVSKNDPDEKRPNVNICPVCLAHPGTLPVINREAVRHVLRVGVALGGKLADYTEFDRKNYFYPDLPKGYQLSQYEFPLVKGGELNGVAITRIHLEEDTARSQHDNKTGETLVDYNRAGVPLMELVTEPVMHSAEECGSFARELQLLLRYLGASEANMEKGEMRVEANISVGKDGHLGTKVEVKNLNSIRSMERAIHYEIQRQSSLLEHGQNVEQETRGWDDMKQATFPQRVKEGSADYRYFPDPDLPSLKLSEVFDFSESALRSDMPELPWERRARYVSMGLKPEDAAMFAADLRFGTFFDAVSKILSDNKEVMLAVNYLANDVAKIIRGIDERDTDFQHEIPFSAGIFAELVHMIAKEEISSRGAKDILANLWDTPTESPRSIADRLDILQKSSVETLEPIVERVLQEHADVVDDYKGGKEAAIMFLVGQAMKATKGSANPQVLRSMIVERIKSK